MFLLIGVIALAAIALPLEFVARRLYTDTPAPPCFDFTDPSTGAKAVPNAVCSQKIYESRLAEYKFNACGHRNPVDCGTKGAGVYRIVLVGSSLALGFPVAYEESFQGLMPRLLSEKTKREVDVYSEGMELRTPRYVLMNFKEIIAAHPDMILWPMTPWDVDNMALQVPEPPGSRNDAMPNASRWEKLKAQVTRKRDITGFFGRHWRAFFMMQHFLYKSDTIYLAHSLSGSDPYDSSLRDHPDKEWQDKLNAFERSFAVIADRAKAAGVPVVVIALPRHAQAAIIAANELRPGLNPYAFGEQMKTIVERHGGIYADILPMFRGMPDINATFFPVDQHLTVAGYRAVAGMMARALTEGVAPALSQAN